MSVERGLSPERRHEGGTRIRNWRNETLTVLAIGSLIILGWADQITGYQLSLAVFYLVPISIIAWARGLWTGVVVAIVSAAVCISVDLVGGHQYLQPEFVAWNNALRLVSFLAIAVLVARLRSNADRLAEISRVDSLTGLCNGRGFYALAGEALESAQRTAESVTAIYLDVDHFKEVNDTRGHAAGDQILVAVGKVLASGRRTDIAARLGGDEFIILLPSTPMALAQLVVERIRERLLEEMSAQGWGVTFSIGMVFFPIPPDTVDQLVLAADRVMYGVKHTTKDGIRMEIAGGAAAQEIHESRVGSKKKRAGGSRPA